VCPCFTSFFFHHPPPSVASSSSPSFLPSLWSFSRSSRLTSLHSLLGGLLFDQGLAYFVVKLDKGELILDTSSLADSTWALLILSLLQGSNPITSGPSRTYKRIKPGTTVVIKDLFFNVRDDSVGAPVVFFFSSFSHQKRKHVLNLSDSGLTLR